MRVYLASYGIGGARHWGSAPDSWALGLGFQGGGGDAGIWEENEDAWLLVKCLWCILLFQRPDTRWTEQPTFTAYGLYFSMMIWKELHMRSPVGDAITAPACEGALLPLWEREVCLGFFQWFLFFPLHLVYSWAHVLYHGVPTCSCLTQKRIKKTVIICIFTKLRNIVNI